MIKITYNQGYILQSDEFIDTLIKSAITFKTNLYKLKKFPLLTHANKSINYFKNFFQ